MNCFKVLSISLLILFSACDKQDDFEARKASDTNTTDGTVPDASSVYLGSLTSIPPSEATCPSGSGAQVTVAFTGNIFEFEIAENSTYAGFNSRIVPTVGTQTLNASLKQFGETYAVADIAGAYDNSSCISNGGYSNVVELIVSGEANSTETIVEADYTISLICNDNARSTICDGEFLGTR